MLICIWHLYLWIHGLDLCIAVSKKPVPFRQPLQVLGAREQKIKNRIPLTGSPLANSSSVSLPRQGWYSTAVFSYSHLLAPEWQQWLLPLSILIASLCSGGLLCLLSALSLPLGLYNPQHTMPHWRHSDAGDTPEANGMCDLVQSDSLLDVCSRGRSHLPRENNAVA